MKNYVAVAIDEIYAFRKNKIKDLNTTKEKYDRWQFTAASVLLFLFPVRNSTVELISKDMKDTITTYEENVISCFRLMDSQRTSIQLKKESKKICKSNEKDASRV